MIPQNGLIQTPLQMPQMQQSVPLQPMPGPPKQLPQSLQVDADFSQGLGRPEGQAAPTDLTNLEQIGLPGHRILELINAWSTGKSREYEAQLEADAFYDGDVWTEDQLKELQERGQSPSNVPIAHTKIDSYIGIGHRLRRDPKAYPITMKKDDNTAADGITAALRHVDQRTNAKTIYSEASRDFFVRGVGAEWRGVRMENGRPEFVSRRISGINFIYDPRSMEWDFADAKYLGEWNWIDVEDAEELLTSLGRPDSAAKVRYLVSTEATDTPGVPAEFMPGGDGWSDSARERVRMVTLYYRHKKQWRVCYVIGKIKLFDAVSPFLDTKGKTRQPYNAASCFVARDGTRYGVMKLMMPLQREVNYRSSKLAWLVAARQVFYEENAVDDINKFKKELRKPNGVMKVKPGALADKRILAEAIQSEIKGQFELLQHAEEQLMRIGPNPSLLGKGEGVNSQSGRALLALQNAGMTEMSTVFERHREFKLASYRHSFMLIKQFWKHDFNRAISVLDDENQAKMIVLNEVTGIDPMTGEPIVGANNIAEIDVDIVIEEGPDVITMKEEMMQFIMQSGQTPVSRIKTAIKFSSIPNQEQYFKILDEENPPPSPEQQDMMRKMDNIKVAQEAVKVDDAIAKINKTNADALSVMVQNQIPSSAFQIFPLDQGANMFLEDAIGAELHPLGNAFSFEPPPMMEPVPMQDGPPQMGPDGSEIPGPQEPAPMQMKPGPNVVPNNPAAPMPNMIGEEPVMGAQGGLPMPPPSAQGGGIVVPPGARMN